jgi:hypothetical protein
MESVFEQLGRSVDERWRLAQYEESALAEIATDEMSSHLAGLSAENLLQSTLTSPALPRQSIQGTKFGQPPVTMFSNERFYIEALYWLDGTTSIHQHGFCGAFHVLGGSSVHCRFTFTADTAVGPHFRLGALRATTVELLQVGDSRPIPSGSGLIHSLFHLDRPSVTVVVRTYGAVRTEPQFSYERPCVAWNPYFCSHELTRQLELLDLAQKVSPTTYEAGVSSLLRRPVFYEVYCVLRHLHQRRPASPAAFLEALDLARTVHGELVDRVQPSFEEARRQDDVMTRRRVSNDEEHRYLLALLLNVWDRDDVISLVERRFPERDPVDTITAWIAPMVSSGGRGPRRPTPLDPGTRLVLANLLRGKGVPEVLADLGMRLGTKADETKVHWVQRLASSLRSSQLFGSLFVESRAAGL